MHRLIRDIAAGVQTLRFLTALICSAAVTTAVAGPMAYQALSFDPQAAVLGTASNTTRSDGPDATGSVPRRSTSTIPPSTAATTASTAPTTAAPTTTPPTPSTMGATTTAPEPTGPASINTIPDVFVPPTTAVPPPDVTLPPDTTTPVTLPPPTTLPQPVQPTPGPSFQVEPMCDEGKAVELDEHQQGTCAEQEARQGQPQQ